MIREYNSTNGWYHTIGIKNNVLRIVPSKDLNHVIKIC